MTDGPPAPEPGASLGADRRGVSTTLGYTLTLSITAVLIAGLLAAGGTLIEEQQRAVATDQLTVAGQQLAAGFEDADRLAATTDDGTVRVNVWLPESVVGGGYQLRLVNHSQPPDQPALATIVATAESADARRNVSFRTEHAVPNRTLSGGPVVLVYYANDSDADGGGGGGGGGDGDSGWEIIENDGGTDGVDPERTATSTPTPSPTPAAFGHEEVVFVDSDTSELSSVAPSGEITRYGVDARAIGPKQVDIDDDGLREVPFVNGDNELRLVDEDGETQTLVNDAAYSPGSYTTLLAIGEWGGRTSVFYLNTTDTVGGEASIYRVSPGEDPEQVTVGGNGVDATAIAGIGDINDNGTDNLVYVGQSQNIWYINGGETDTGQGVGSNLGNGVGYPRVFDSGEQDAVPFVSGGNEIKLLRDSPGSSLTGNAAKTSVAGIDWAGNDTLEVVYVDSSDSTLRYVSLNGSVETVDDSDGNPIEVDESAGVA